jgi:ATP synthase protein I
MVPKRKRAGLPMSDPRDPAKSTRGHEGQLSERLRRLEDSLVRVGRRKDQAGGERPASAVDAQGMARALRLSSEFIAGIVAGAGVGWGFDWLLGTSPWGLIVFLMLGFAAGVLNVLRAAGLSGTAPPPGG